MIDHNGQFANLGEKNRAGNKGIRNGEDRDQSPGDYYYDDGTGYEPYDSETDEEDDDEKEDRRSDS